MSSPSPFAGLTTEAQAARAWPFEQARNLLARFLKSRLNDDAERDLAATLIRAGKTDEALAALVAAKRNYDGSYSKLHPNHGDLLVNRAVILAKAGRQAEAKADCARGMEILNSTMDPKESFVVASAKTCAGLVGRA